MMARRAVMLVTAEALEVTEQNEESSRGDEGENPAHQKGQGVAMACLIEEHSHRRRHQHGEQAEDDLRGGGELREGFLRKKALPERRGAGEIDTGHHDVGDETEGIGARCFCKESSPETEWDIEQERAKRDSQRMDAIRQ